MSCGSQVDPVIEVNPAEAKALNNQLPPGFMYVPISALQKEQLPQPQEAEVEAEAAASAAAPDGYTLSPIPLRGTQAKAATSVPAASEAALRPKAAASQALAAPTDVVHSGAEPIESTAEHTRSVSAIDVTSGASPSSLQGLQPVPLSSSGGVGSGRTDKVLRKARTGEHRHSSAAGVPKQGPSATRPPGASASRSMRRPKR